MPAKWSSVIGHNFFFATSLADGDIYALLNHRDAAFVRVRLDVVYRVAVEYFFLLLVYKSKGLSVVFVTL